MQARQVELDAIAADLASGYPWPFQANVRNYIPFLVGKRGNWQFVDCDAIKVLDNRTRWRAFHAALQALSELPRHRHDRNSLVSYSSMFSMLMWTAAIISNS